MILLLVVLLLGMQPNAALHAMSALTVSYVVSSEHSLGSKTTKSILAIIVTEVVKVKSSKLHYKQRQRRSTVPPPPSLSREI